MADGTVSDGGPLSTVVLDVNDLVAVVADVGLDLFMDELISELGSKIAAFDPSAVEHKIRAGFNYVAPEHGLVEWMPSMMVGDTISVKTVGYHPQNPEQRGIPSVLATTALYDPTTGALSAICEATLLTAMRTGAASAAVTNLVTAPGSIVLGVVGCGAQAVTQIHAISRVRRIERLVVTDTNQAVASSLGRRLPAGLPIPEVFDRPSFDSAVSELDVLCTCTSVGIGIDSVVDLSLAKPNLHINAVGADFPGKTELPLDYLRVAVVIPDVVDQCLVEGESQRLDPDELGPNIVEVLSKAIDGLVQKPTVFDSTGWSYEDLLAARLFWSHANRLGLGTTVELQRAPTDPYDPYETLRPSQVVQPDGPALMHHSESMFS